MLIASSCSSNIQQDENGQNIRVTAEKSGHTLLSDIYSKIAPFISGKMVNLKPETFILRMTSREIFMLPIINLKMGRGWNG